MRVQGWSLALGGIALSACVQANADETPVYRWTDAKGVVHYGEQPPNDVSAKPIDPELGRRNVIQALEAGSPAAASRPRGKGEASAADDGRCNEVRTELRRVDTALRGGYSVAEGERLKRRQRELRWQRLRDCGP